MCARTAGSSTLPVVDAEDDLVAVPRLRGEAVFQQVRGALRVGVGQREVVGVFRPRRLREGAYGDDQGDPGGDDVAAMGGGPAGELEHPESF